MEIDVGSPYLKWIIPPIGDMDSLRNIIKNETKSWSPGLQLNLGFLRELGANPDILDKMEEILEAQIAQNLIKS